MADEEQSTPNGGILETIVRLVNVLRHIVAVLNLIVIVLTFYFLISAKNLGGVALQMAPWFRVLFSLLVIAAAVHGIVVSYWFGKKFKLHTKLFIAYWASIIILGLTSIILAIIYVRRKDNWDVIFIIISCFMTFLISMTSYALFFALKKTKLLRNVSAFTAMFS